MIKTNPKFWDCNCEENYIRPKSLKVCPICKAEEDECPDSREDEIAFFELNNSL